MLGRRPAEGREPGCLGLSLKLRGDPQLLWPALGPGCLGRPGGLAKEAGALGWPECALLRRGAGLHRGPSLGGLGPGHPGELWGLAAGEGCERPAGWPLLLLLDGLEAKLDGGRGPGSLGRGGAGRSGSLWLGPGRGGAGRPNGGGGGSGGRGLRSHGPRLGNKGRLGAATKVDEGSGRPDSLSGRGLGGPLGGGRGTGSNGAGRSNGGEGLEEEAA